MGCGWVLYIIEGVGGKLEEEGRGNKQDWIRGKREGRGRETREGQRVKMDKGRDKGRDGVGERGKGQREGP